MANFRNGYLQLGAPLGSTPLVKIAANNQVLDLQTNPPPATIYVISDGLAANRSLAISPGGTPGQNLSIMFVGSSNGVRLVSGGNIQLVSGTWTATTNGTAIALQWNGTYWVEMSRNNVSAAPAVPTVVTINVSADGQVIDTGSYSTVFLNSEDNSYYFTLANGDTPGRQVNLVSVGAPLNFSYSQTNAIVRGPWLPTQYGETLTLVWDDTNTVWEEVARSMYPRTRSYTLGSATQNIDANGYDTIYLQPDSTVADDRLIALFDGNFDGQRVSLLMTSIDMTTFRLTGSNVRLSAPYSPFKRGAMITLEWRGDYWYEVARNYTTPLVASNVVSQSEITGMFGEPVIPIGTPGPGYTIVVDEIEFYHAYSSTPYAGGGDVVLKYQNSGDVILTIDSSLVTASSSLKSYARPTIYAATGSNTGFDLLANDDSAIQLTNLVGAFTGGNVANTLTYRIKYHIIQNLI